MKKLQIATITFLLAFTVQAQDIVYGAKAGINFASLNGDVESEASGRTSIHLGGFGEYMLTDQIGLQAELLYSAQGNKLDISSDGFTEESTLKLTYLNIPLLGKYYFTENISVEAGPQIGLLLSAENEFTFTDSDFPEDNESGTVDIKDGLNGLDLAFAIGGTYKLDSGLSFSLRYNIGLSNINSEGSASAQNAVFQISAGYILF